MLVYFSPFVYGAEKPICANSRYSDSHRMFCFPTVKPVVPKCSVPKSVPLGKSAELSCVEEEGFPKSQYQWFKNMEEIPDDPKTSVKFFNSSYTLSTETGTLVSTRACVCSDKGRYERPRAGQQGRWPDAQGWRQIFWGDSWWRERAWAMRGICCPRLHIPLFSLALQHSGDVTHAHRLSLSERAGRQCCKLRRFKECFFLLFLSRYF